MAADSDMNRIVDPYYYRVYYLVDLSDNNSKGQIVVENAREV